MLEFEQVYKSFGENKVLRGVSLTVQEGRIITVIGPSGSGKSTLLKLILGLEIPDQGNLSIDGVNLGTLSERQMYKIREKLGLLFQSAALFDSMTVEDNVGFSLRESGQNYNLEELNYKVDQALDRVGMTGTNSMFPEELSGGQQKRIGLARAIINEPNYLLFDEPTTGLDPILSTSIEDLIVQISNELNTTAIVVTHQISTVLRVSDEIYYLHEGRLLDSETPKSIVNTSDPIISSFIHGGLNGKE